MRSCLTVKVAKGELKEQNSMLRKEQGVGGGVVIAFFSFVARRRNDLSETTGDRKRLRLPN